MNGGGSGITIGPGALRARSRECEVVSARAFHSDREGMNGVSSITRSEFLHFPGDIDGMHDLGRTRIIKMNLPLLGVHRPVGTGTVRDSNA